MSFRKQQQFNNSALNCNIIANQKRQLKEHKLMKSQYQQAAQINPKLIKQLQNTLQKSIENRLSADHNIINKFTNDLAFFEQLSEHTSIQIARYLAKWAKVIRIPSSRVVTEVRKPNHSLFILLSGGIGITNSSPDKFVHMKKDAQKMETLIEKGFRYVRKYRFSAKIYNKQQARFGTNTVFRKVELTDYNFQSRFYSQKVLGFEDHFAGQQYESTAITLNDSVFLQIKTPYLMDAMNVYKNVLLDQKLKVFVKACSIFSEIPLQRMKFLMQKTQTRKLCKGQYLFKQGDKSEHFYIVKQGQFTLKKTIKLFKQDPNRLYRNRKHMRSSSGQKTERLTFSNFQSVYNYQQQQKIIDLSVISGAAIFGEQQLYQKKARETSAKVTSIEAEVFLVSFKLIAAVLIEKKDDKRKSIDVQQFKRKLYQYYTNDKILYRQQKLAQVLDTKNKLHMNYFFIDQEKTQKQTPQQLYVKNDKNARRSLRKFNRQIQYISQSQKCKISYLKNQQQNTFITGMDNFQTKEDFHQPTYNRFNFSKFNQKQTNSDLQISVNMSTRQNKIADLTHTVSDINKKVSQMCERGSKLGVKKYSIDIKNPLFSLDYFTKIKKQALRIQKKKRQSIYDSVSKLNTSSNSICKSAKASTRPQSASTTFRTFRRLQQ